MSQYSVSLSLQVQQALQALKNLTGNFKKVDKEVSATTKELERFEKELQSESATIKNTITAQTQYINKLKGMQAGLDKSSAKFKSVSAEITRFEAKLKGGTTAVQGLTGALAVLGVGVALGRITSEVSDLGKQFSAAQGAVRSLTGDAGFDDVAASISKVVQESGGLSNQIEATEASYQLLSAGVSGAADIQDVLGASIKLSTAGFTDNTTAVDALTTVINAYGLEANQAAILSDQLVQTQNDGKLTINEYGASLGKVIPTAAQLNVQFGEINAAIAAITLQGNNAEIATSGLNSAFQKLAAPTGEGEKILAKYGITVNAASIKADGLVGTLEKLQKITSDQDRIELFGAEANKALGPLLNSFENFKELVENQADAAGVAQKGVDALAGSYADLTKRNENLRSDLGVQIFEQVKVAIGAVLVVTNKLLSAFLNLPGPVKNVAIGLGLIAAAGVGIGLTVAALGAMKLAILAATGATTLWTAATTLLAAAWSVIISPITLTVVAIAAVIAAVVLLYNKFEPFKNLVDAIGNEFMYWGGEAIKIIKAIGAFAGVMIDNYIKGWQQFFSVVGELWGRFTRFIGTGFESMKTKGAQTLDNIKNFFGNAKKTISNIWSALTGNVNQNTESIGETGGKTANGLMKSFGDAAKWIGEQFSRLFRYIAGLAMGVLGQINGIMKKLFNIDVAAGLKNAVNAAKKAYADASAPDAADASTKDKETKDAAKPGVELPTNSGDGSGKKGGGGGKKESEAERAAKKRAEEVAKSFEKGQDIIRQYQQTLELQEALTENEKFRIKLKQETENNQRTINELIDIGQKTQLTELNTQIQQNKLKEREAEISKAKAEAMQGILGNMEDEISLLEAKLVGNEKEIKDMIEIRDLKAQIAAIPNSTPQDQQNAVNLLKRKKALEETATAQEKLKETTKQYAEMIVGPLVDGFRAVAEGTKSASEAIGDAFADIGKSFIDMAAQMIKEFLVMQAIGLIKSFFSPATTAATPLVDSLSQAPGGMFDPGGSMPFFGMNSWGSGRAGGGAVSEGIPYLVGERGPEIVVPSSNGQVIPNGGVPFLNGGNGGDSGNSPLSVPFSNSSSVSRIERSNRETVEAMSNPGALNVRFDSQVINSVEYVTAAQHREGMAQAAEQGRMLTLSTMQNSVKTRRRVGI